VVQQVVSKAEERQIFMDSQFESVSARYWQLMTQSNVGKDRSKTTLSKAQYTDLLTRIYRVLAPLYRETEMASAVSQEWVYDAAGCTQLTHCQFQKMLFRIAH
jgi:hypothetical protein